MKEDDGDGGKEEKEKNNFLHHYLHAIAHLCRSFMYRRSERKKS
jgi:hypothetical protein